MTQTALKSVLARCTQRLELDGGQVQAPRTPQLVLVLARCFPRQEQDLELLVQAQYIPRREHDNALLVLARCFPRREKVRQQLLVPARNPRQEQERRKLLAQVRCSSPQALVQQKTLLVLAPRTC